MDDNPEPKRFQFHLSTAVVLMLTVGALMTLNLVKFESDEGPTFPGWPIGRIEFNRTGQVIKQEHFGFPLNWVWVHKRQSPGDANRTRDRVMINELALLIDVLSWVGLALLLYHLNGKRVRRESIPK